MSRIHDEKTGFSLRRNQRRISAVTAQLISAFVFSFTYSSQNFEHIACFCDCTGRFVSHLVGNPEDRFSGIEAHLSKVYSVERIYFIVLLF